MDDEKTIKLMKIVKNKKSTKRVFRAKTHTHNTSCANVPVPCARPRPASDSLNVDKGFLFHFFLYIL